MEHEMNEIMERLLDGFDKSNKDAYAKLVFKTVSNLTESGYDMKDPDVFSTVLVFQQDNVMELIAEEFHEPCKKKENQHKANFVFTHYFFLENHIRKLIESRCGSSCVVDRCRTIIREYLIWLISGELNEFNPEIECYWIPKFGTYKDWFSFCNSLYELYHGKIDNYLVRYQYLTKCSIRTYEHLQHDWYIKLKSEEPFLFMTTYDNNKENPLDNGYYNKKNIYLIPKSIIPDTLKEKCFDPEIDGIQGKLLSAIRKEDVENIYSETKIIYI